MYIHPALLLLFLIMYVFTPSMNAWVLAGEAAWYRPWLAWLLVIALVLWLNRDRDRADHGL